MTAGELIKRLQEFDPGLEVYFAYGHRDGGASTISVAQPAGYRKDPEYGELVPAGPEEWESVPVIELQ